MGNHISDFAERVHEFKIDALHLKIVVLHVKKRDLHQNIPALQMKRTDLQMYIVNLHHAERVCEMKGSSLQNIFSHKEHRGHEDIWSESFPKLCVLRDLCERSFS